MLRPYKKEDIPRIVELEKVHLESSLEESYYVEDMTNPLAKHYVFEIEGQVIGFISSIFDGFSIDILNLVIHQDFQEQGYGTKMLAAFLDEFVPLGVNSVSLEVRASNGKAIHLYEKLGFNKIHVRKEYYNHREDAYVMQKLYDTKKDMANLESILFSKKCGLKFTSDFKERYCLNYYDLYDYKIKALHELQEEDYLYVIANWTDYQLFDGFDISSCALMHVNAYQYHSLSKKQHKVHLNYLEDHLDFTYQVNLEYGEEYAKKYAEFSFDKIKENKIKLFSVLEENKTIGHVQVLEYHHSIFLLGVYVDAAYRNQGIASALIDACISYAKTSKKLEVYLEADAEDTPIQMYERMNFKQIEQIYEMFKEKAGTI